MTEWTDEQLLARHRSGVPGAIDQLVRRYSDDVFGFLFRFVRSSAAAEDLVQETFLQVHLSAASFDESRSFKPWLYTIAANKARDYVRSRSRRQEVSLDAPGQSDEGPGAAESIAGVHRAPSDELAQSEEHDEVHRIVAGMPDHLRVILLMGYFQQLPYADIAEALEIPLGTVKSRLHAAVQHFSRQWQQRGKHRSSGGRAE